MKSASGKKSSLNPTTSAMADYARLMGGITRLLETARRQTARSVNAILTATYWEIGCRIVEFEQGGKRRAGYGEELLVRLAGDLTSKFGRGFGMVNLSQMKKFYLLWPAERIFQTPSEKFGVLPGPQEHQTILQTLSEK